ncbi:MAG TPA: oligosaccharide flippase family protein [Sphingobacteriaceae bacterium]
MTEQRTSYRQIIKSTSVFGGVQVFNIILNIIRSKALAIFLGPVGMGISGLLLTAITLVAGITNFGLGTSAVKNVAEAYASGNEFKVSRIIIILKRCVLITGMLGVLVTILSSSWLSKLSFGNDDYVIAFTVISVSLLFNQIAVGQLAILQGLRKIPYLAKANLLGTFLGVVVTIPMYFFWGKDAIVPAIIISSFMSLSSTWYFSQKVKMPAVQVSVVRTYAEGKNMFTMGFLISLSLLLANGSSYLVQNFISNVGGVKDVGLYLAGFAIINNYVGIIFSAMAADYYPRLAAIPVENNTFSNEVINQQAEITLLILAPIILVFLVFINVVIVILYSRDFIEVNGMIYWAALGMFFKAASWPIAYVFLAKGVSKLYFWNELVAAFYILVFNMLGYYYFGLKGLGYAFTLGYFLYLLQLMIIVKAKYDFRFSRSFYMLFAVQFLLAISCFLIVVFLEEKYAYLIGICLIIVSSLYSLKLLDNRIEIKSYISRFRNKSR